MIIYYPLQKIKVITTGQPLVSAILSLPFTARVISLGSRTLRHESQLISLPKILFPGHSSSHELSFREQGQEGRARKQQNP